MTWKQAGGDITLSTFPGQSYADLVWDLDQVLATAGVALDSDVYLKFWQTGAHTTSVMTFDDVRVSAVERAGPRITGSTPTGTQAGPVSSMTVTFNEDIDASTFTAADIRLVSPTGQLVELAGDPVDSGDHRTFTINLASGQSVARCYALRVGPDVRNINGNWMNQDNDNFNGESLYDEFVGTLTIGPTAAVALPIAEGFEGADIGALDGWSFAVNYDTPNGGTIDITGADGPYQGADHLRFHERHAQRLFVARRDPQARSFGPGIGHRSRSRFLDPAHGRQHCRRNAQTLC